MAAGVGFEGVDAAGADFVFGDLGDGVEDVDGEEVGGGFGEVPAHVDGAGRDATGDPGAGFDGAAAGANADEAALGNAEAVGVFGGDFDQGFGVGLVEA